MRNVPKVMIDEKCDYKNRLEFEFDQMSEQSVKKYLCKPYRNLPGKMVDEILFSNYITCIRKVKAI